MQVMELLITATQVVKSSTTCNCKLSWLKNITHLTKCSTNQKHSGSLNSNVHDKHAEWKGTQSCVASYEAAATVVLL